MSNKVQRISFYATVNAVRTTTEGAIRISLDLPEDAINTAAFLMNCKRNGIILIFTAETVQQYQEQFKENKTDEPG